MCENAKPGSPPSQWDVSGGNAGSSSIQGFATDISVNVGSTISFKIKTTSTNYSLTIYRMGYYQGNGAHQVTVVTPSAHLPQTQPACLTVAATGLVDCGNWAVSASWAVPSDAVSGVYFAKLNDAATGASSHIPFVVRNDAGTSAIVFRTNDTTWEAYNDYGGNNLYYGSAPTGCGADDGYTCGRAFKVSYNRPFNDRSEASGYGTANYIFYGEYPMIRWMEANGYDVSYLSMVDLDRNPALLRNHKLVVTSGHDEYWSAAERSALQSARDAGVNIASFAGNTGFWKTRMEPSIDGSNTPYRTLVTYKETLDNKVEDPLDPPTWTGTWRDPRFSPPADGGQPENALLGTLFTVNRGSAAPVISSAFAKLRFWRNTAVAGLTGSQTATLGAQVIGYEWDEDLDNGFRPAGLFDMAATSVNVAERITDYGLVYLPALAVWGPTLYRAASGALVFSSGTVQWAWGLDVNHDTAPDIGPTTPNLTMQQATVNLFADLRAQPATLQSGLVAATASTDTTTPTSTITSPTQNAQVPSSALVISGTASDAGGGVVAGVEVSVDSGSTWHKATLSTAATSSTWTYTWNPDSPVSVTLKSRAVDDSGNVETPSSGVNITVVCPCRLGYTKVGSLTDTNDSNNLDGSRFTATTGGVITSMSVFVGDVGSAPNNQYQLGIYNDTNGAPGSVLAHSAAGTLTANSWNTLQISATLSPNTAYWFVYNSNSTSELNDMRYDSPVSGVSEMYSTSAVAFGTWPTTFTATTEPSWAFSIYATYSGSGGGGTSTPTATPTPVPPTTTGTPPTVTNTPTATSTPTATNTASATSTPAATSTPVACPCSSIFGPNATPAVSSSGDANAVEVGMKFTSDVSGYITGVRFYKGTANTGAHVGSLWSSTGQQLAAATFVNETAGGWQQVLFATSVAVTAGATYVASYHTNTGNYSYTTNGFAAAVDNAPLHAPSSASSGGNGVYTYGASQAPTQSFNATNYWVDVLFASTGAPTATPTKTPIPPTATNTTTPGAPTATTTPAPPTATATSTPIATNTASATSTPAATSTPVACPCSSLFGPSATPAVSSSGDANAVEVGMKFTSDVSGYITGIRFYKGTANTGVHVGSLWSSTGQQLAGATFANETANGWQQVLFATSVAVTAGATYVVSYHTNTGNYSYTSNGFAAAVDNAPLHAPSSVSSGGNGVYAYGAGQAPTQSFNATNYWVDVLFAATGAPTATPTKTPIPPTATNTTTPGVSTATNTPAPPTVTATNTPIPPTATNTTTPGVPTLTNTPAPPTATATNTPLAPTATNTATPGVPTLTNTPALPTATATNTPVTCPCSLFSAGATPAVITDQDSNAVELGMKFVSDVGGKVTGIRFYKGPSNTGSHVGNLWSSSGQLLSTVTFTGETAGGWQQASFAQPVTISAGTPYVVSYHTNAGFYSANESYFAAAVDNPPLHGIANASSGNGVYAYGASQFPVSSFNATNYWVDVVFSL